MADQDLRQIPVSPETIDEVNKLASKKLTIYSFFPIDRADCDCHKLILGWQKKLGEATEVDRESFKSQTLFLECPRDKTNLTRYQVTCQACNEVMGYCWATDATLNDWCDFHYVLKAEEGVWKGCFTPHISPIDQKLCFECCCGVDTRDFRANMTMPQRQADAIEAQNQIGRDFNQPDSKFLATAFEGDVIV